MQFSVTFRHMEASEALKSYAKERMDRIRKYLPDPIACHVVFGVERHNHRVDVNFQLHNGLAIAGHETTENMYSSIDLVIAKIERQVRRYKGKIEEQRVRPHHVASLPWSHSIVKEATADHEAVAPEPPAPEATRPAPRYSVIKTEEFHANPMGVDDAIAQLELTHASVLVFRSLEAGNRVSVVYRRDDGSYGLIETPAVA
jgi:putative sigma-54 modulation protein